MRKIYILTLLLIATLTACKKEIIRDLPECEFSTIIVFNYNEENTTADNQLKHVAKVLDIYVYDESGKLVKAEQIEKSNADNDFTYKPEIGIGKYSIIAVANMSDQNKITGTTQREDMIISLNAAANGSNENGDRLYYGYRTFSVVDNHMGKVRVDMVHSHCVIRFTIKWRGTPPPDAGSYFVKMNEVPSEYNLMPQYIYTSPGSKWEEHIPTKGAHDRYLTISDDIRHRIPTVYNDRNILNHSNTVFRLTNEIRGEMVTYRLREAGQTMFSVFAPNGTGTAEVRVMKDIHLNGFLKAKEIDLDHTLKQEYEIVFEIDDENGLVYVYFPDIADWDEGSWVQ